MEGKFTHAFRSGGMEALTRLHLLGSM